MLSRVVEVTETFDTKVVNTLLGYGDWLILGIYTRKELAIYIMGRTENA